MLCTPKEFCGLVALKIVNMESQKSSVVSEAVATHWSVSKSLSVADGTEGAGVGGLGEAAFVGIRG